MSDRADRAIPGKVDLRWWLAEQPHKAIWANTSMIAKHSRARRMQDLYYACMYDDSELAALVQGTSAISSFTPQTMTQNIVRRQVDAYVAKISKNRPVPMPLTTGGNYAQQRRAKALGKFFEGVLDTVNFWPARTMRIRDGAIFGSGFARNFRRGRKLRHERVYPWEIRVDPREAMYGTPRNLYLRRFVDRAVLTEEYPEAEDDIRQAQSRAVDDTWEMGWDETSDLVLVEEAWHLPSRDVEEGDGKKEHDGRHAIAISNRTLCNDAYVRDYFPFSKNDFSPGLLSWWGEGMVKQLAGLQYEVNAIGLRLQEQGYMTGTYVWVPGDSGIETDTLDNGVLSVIRSMQEPKFFTPAAWSPQIFDYYMALRGQFPGELTGNSQQTTRGEKPAGLNSGKALRAFHDIEAEQFTPQGREDERDAIDTCWQYFDLMEEIADEPISDDDERKPYEVKVEERKHGTTALKGISYDKVRMDKAEITLRTFPTNFLASTPEDRWSQVEEMAKTGLWAEDEIISLIDFPDVKRKLNLRNGPREALEAIFDEILDSDDPKPIYPEPIMDLNLAVSLGALYYLQAKWIDKAPDNVTAVILDFVTNSREMRDGKPKPPMDPSQAPMGAPPEALVPPPGMPSGPPGVLPPPPGAPPPPAPGALTPQTMGGMPPG